MGAIGLGCMGMSFAYGPADDDESLRVLDRALELGVNHWDTADMYGAGNNERLLAQRLNTKRDQVFLATKFGNVHDRTLTTHQDLVQANQPWIIDGTPGYARKCLEASLMRLGVDHIELYYLHRVDPRTPIEDTVGEMAKFVKEGKVGFLGVSEVAPETLRRAHATHPIAAVQNELSLWTRDSVEDVLPVVEALGVALVAYSPLGRGFLTGQIKTIDDLPADDWRRSNPRFMGENFGKNFEIVREVEKIARDIGATTAQVAIAWTLGLSQNILPIPGTKRLKYLEENATADSVILNPSHMATLNALSTAAGSRYVPAHMAFVKA